MNIISKKELEAKMVSISGKKIHINSLKYSEEFKFNHADTLRKIRKLSMTHSRVKNEFKESIFINERNREYPYFEMTRDGYMFLIMQMGNASSKESAKLITEKQWLFIDAFNKMEEILSNQRNTEWITEREQGKEIRKLETDAIKDFVEYATLQGSKGAKYYYKHFTQVSYKALSLLEYKRPKTRDTLDLLQLHQLVLAESIVTNVIKIEMQKGTPYKDIFTVCKEALDTFAKTLYITIKETK